MMPEFQQTGFRQIKRCTEFEAASQSLISDSYLNEACQMYNGTIAQFTGDETLQGAFAEPGTQPTSMFSFMLVMGFFALIFTYILNRGKQSILREIYSKISIVER